MDKSLFIDKLNNLLFEEQRIFKVHLATLVSKKVLKIVFIVEARKYDKYLNDELQQKVEEQVRKIVPDIFDIEIAYKKTFTEEKLIKRAIMDYVYKEFPFIFSLFVESEVNIEIKGNQLEILIAAQSYIYKFCQENQLNIVLEDYLNSCFMEQPTVRIIESSNKTEIKINTQQEINNVCSIKVIDISITEHLVGIIGKKPRYIVDVKDAEAETMTLCGIISNLKELTYKKEGVENKFYTFTLNDTTSTIEVKFFPRSKKARLIAPQLVEGDILAIEGPLRNDRFSNSIVIFANRIAKCKIDYDSIDTSPIFKKENEFYINVFPQPFAREQQVNLFSDERKDIEKLFSGKTFVVFDLETTGTSIYDKITEIGAVKIVDGMYVEIFQTLVNPEIPIPPEVVKLTAITNKMVQDEFIFDEVVADFYKFTRNSTLVAHNAPFDIAFLTRQARQSQYNFDNTVVDTLTLAKQNLKLSRYTLSAVCKRLNVKLVSAHRAMSDALATAEVFKKLIILKEKE